MDPEGLDRSSHSPRDPLAHLPSGTPGLVYTAAAQLRRDPSLPAYVSVDARSTAEHGAVSFAGADVRDSAS